MTTTVLATALALVLTGCGVSTNDEPQAIPRENVPADLLDADVGRQGDDLEVEGTDAEQVQVWFLVEDDEITQLHEVNRRVPWPAQAARRLDLLIGPRSGPTDEEREAGISTAIPPDARLTALPTQDGPVLEVSLSNDFYVRGGNNFIKAVAQLVFTAADIPGVEAVRFISETGEEIPVLDGDGESQDEPVTPDDYANLDPRRE
ncbi:MAG: GerMN domain-containing protein [Acidimicrobiales bacterium]